MDGWRQERINHSWEADPKRHANTKNGYGGRQRNKRTARRRFDSVSSHELDMGGRHEQKAKHVQSNWHRVEKQLSYDQSKEPTVSGNKNNSQEMAKKPIEKKRATLEIPLAVTEDL